MSRSRSVPATLLLVAAHGVVLPAAPVDVRIPGAETPAIVERLATTAGLTALAIGPDLDLLAAAFLESEKPERSVLLFFAGDAEPSRVEVPGLIRDLLFSSDRSRVYGLLHRKAKKGEGETQLIVYEIEQAKLRRAVRVPTSARSLDHWTAGGSLLIAGENEIRTFTLPDLRSGPLFRVIGANLALTSVGGGDLVLVGQQDAVILVGLSDPPGQHEMPIRARVAAPGPVVALASTPDGTEALARLEDGRLYGVTLNPLRLQEQGTTEVLASLPGHDDPPATTVAEPAAAPGPAAPEPDEFPVEAPMIAVIPPPDSPAPTPEPDATGASAPDASGPEVASEVTVSPPVDAPAEAAIISEAQVSGRILGAAADAVVAVVLLGPDNLLREAARVTPTSDGRWEVNGLEPGRYRVQLDGGGGRVLVNEPAFLLLEVEDDRKLEAPDFVVRRTL